MTQVIIKQLTGCMNASLYICHGFSICLLLCLCLAWSHLVKLSVCLYGVCMYVLWQRCLAQHSTIDVPALLLQHQAQGTLKPKAHGTQGKKGTVMTSSLSGHAANSNPLSELLQKTTYFNIRGVLTTHSQFTILVLSAQPLSPLGCSVFKWITRPWIGITFQFYRSTCQSSLYWFIIIVN